MNYLIDTNIISEVRKGERCNSHVAAWFASIDDRDIYLSVLVLGEIRKGVEGARRTDASQARALEKWLSTVKESYGERILPIDQMVAEEWGSMSAIHGFRRQCDESVRAADKPALIVNLDYIVSSGVPELVPTEDVKTRSRS